MKKTRNPLLRPPSVATALAVLALLASPLARAQAVAPAKPAPETEKPVPKEKDIVELTPFTVTTDKDTGYFAENTLAGSRLNTNLADLAASITVVTKQQMDDTAALDINDVFKYEANTEGSSTYSPSVVDRGTVKDTVSGYTYGNDGSTTNNAQSNRIRGLQAPDAGLNNYPTNNRVAFDAYNTQSIEITRGPNSLLFGLGTPSGVVNQNAAQAVLNRNTNSVSVRTDQVGSFRTSLSINRSLIKDKLAIFGAFLYNNQQFERKPSRDLTRREYAALTYKPFKNTVIRGFLENFLNDANRPNFFAPRDQVSAWLQAGRPAYDPIARTVTILDTNKVLGPYVSSNQSPGYNAAVNTIVGVNALTTTTSPLYVPGIMFDDVGRPLRRIDNGAIVDFFARQPQFYAPAQTNPATATPSAASLGWTAQDPRYLFLDRYWSSSTGPVNPTANVNGQTYTYGSYQGAGVTNKSIYDWTKYNILQPNFDRMHASNYNLEIEQQILPNLFFNAGWLRQDIDESSNYTLNSLTGATVRIDTTTKMINGSPNPYFGLPFVAEGEGGGLDTFFLPETDDNYRAMLAYDLDFTKNAGWSKWLGRHRMLGLWSEQDAFKQVERWRMNYVDGDADGKLRYTTNLALPGQQQALSTATMRRYYLASPGAPQATVSHSPGFYGNQGWQTPLTSQVEVWNYNTGQFQKDTLKEQILFSPAGSGQGSTQREVKSKQLALQSYLWEERLIATLGWRQDDYRARVTTTGPIIDATGKVVAPTLPNSDLYLNGNTGIINHDLVMKRWNRWDALSGRTKTIGAAFRPLRGLGFVQRLAGEHSTFSEFLNGLTLYYNKSDNFNPPATFQTDYFGKPLPKPTGSGRDIGIGFNLLGNKLVARINWYETESQNERTNSANLLLGRLAYNDTTTGIPWASAVQRIRNGLAAGRTLDQIVSVNNWNSDAINSVADATSQQKIWDMLKLPVNYYSGLSSGATQQSKGKGVEVQLTYNPIRNWTMKLTGSKSEATYTGVAPQYDAWRTVRQPVWDSMVAAEIPDFTDGAGNQYSLKKFWTGYGFASVTRFDPNTGRITTPRDYDNNVVVSQVALAKALEGAVSPLQRIYHASFLTNYSFTNEAFGGKLRGFSVGGSARWESKAAIGFYGKVGDPVNSPTIINLNDITRPIYDNGNYYADVWAAYSRKIFSDRIGWKLQLNVNNVNESGRLMPTQVNFDGTPWAFRIIDPRQFILTSTFTF